MVKSVLGCCLLLSIAHAFQMSPLPLRAESAKSCSGRRSALNSVSASAAPIYQAIEQKLTEGLKPLKLRIIDNSHQHAGHAGVAGRSGETHFEVMVVSEAFKGLRPVARHQLVYKLLDSELDKGAGGIHALQISARTPEEEAKPQA